MVPAIFLDRDGVIIEHRPNYVRSWADVEFIPGIFPALARLATTGYQNVIITNQAGIGRGLFTRKTVDEINCRIGQEIIRANGRIDGIYTCPHLPEDCCACRKPRPGLILQAAEELDLDLANSILIGDNLSDIQAGQAAGVGQVVLVRTGLGARFAQNLTEGQVQEIKIYDDLAQALERLVFHR
jgi:histidinol-phosphate phosphatase family protein